MQRAKAFFFVCSGVFLLALAYHLGATSVSAQGPGNPIVAMSGPYEFVLTTNGDLYAPAAQANVGAWVRAGNVFAGGPTPPAQPTWGQLKAQYRK